MVLISQNDEQQLWETSDDEVVTTTPQRRKLCAGESFNSSRRFMRASQELAEDKCHAASEDILLEEILTDDEGIWERYPHAEQMTPSSSPDHDRSSHNVVSPFAGSSKSSQEPTEENQADARIRSRQRTESCPFSHPPTSNCIDYCNPCAAFPQMGNADQLTLASACYGMAHAAFSCHSSPCASALSLGMNLLAQHQAAFQPLQPFVPTLRALAIRSQLPANSTQDEDLHSELTLDGHEREKERKTQLYEAAMIEPAYCKPCGKLASCVTHPKECKICGWRRPEIGEMLFRPNQAVHRVVKCGYCGASAVGCSNPVRFCDCGLTATELLFLSYCKHVKHEVCLGCLPARRGECNRRNCSFCHCALPENSKITVCRKPKAGEPQQPLALPEHMKSLGLLICWQVQDKSVNFPDMWQKQLTLRLPRDQTSGTR